MRSGLTVAPRRRFVVLAAGSGGDVAPFARIAAKLVEQGHPTVLMAPGRYAALAEGTGVRFESLGADEVFEEVFTGTDIWHPRRGLAASWHYYGAAMNAAHARIRAGFDPADTDLVSSTFAVGARLAESLDGFRNTTVHLSPAVIFSGEAPPAWPGVSLPAQWPVWLKQAVTRAAERWGTDPVIGRAVNPALARAGQPAEHRLFSRWIHSPRSVLYAFPEWFAPAAGDWPAGGRHTAFPLGPGQEAPLPADLSAWLAATRGPLIVVTAGTAVHHRPAWIDTLEQAARRLGARVLSVGPGATRIEDGGGVFRTPHVPFPRVLPQASLVVHHGGIGTFAEALRCGTRQWMVPGAHDQFDNAARAERLGLAQCMTAQSLQQRAAEALGDALASATMAPAVAALHAREALREDGASLIAEAVSRSPLP